MFKKVGIIFFLAYYLVFMILPNLPFVQYYYGQSKHSKDTQIIANNDSKVLIGDMCYLNALIERTKQTKDSNKDKTLPQPNNGSTNLVYLVAELTNLNNINNSQVFIFQNPLELLTYRYLKIPSPPPKYFS